MLDVLPVRTKEGSTCCVRALPWMGGGLRLFSGAGLGTGELLTCHSLFTTLKT